MSGLSTRREAVVRFATFVAHTLNSTPNKGPFEDYRIYLRLVDVLAGLQGGASTYYAEKLTGHWLVSDRMGPDDAAQMYFDCVLRRKLFLARANHWHKGHELILAACRREPDPAALHARLVRAHNPPVPFRAKPPKEFSTLKDRLAKVDRTVSSGNPAISTRNEHGPLHIEIDLVHCEIPEELSIWDAIQGAPRAMVVVGGEDWIAFRNIVIKALEAAHAPYGALLSVGLWPPDWQDTVSTNTVKRLSAFLSAVKGRSETHSHEIWRSTWDEGYAVPGFASAEALWSSEIGHAIRHPPRHRTVAIDNMELADGEDEEATILDRAAFGQILERCCAAGVIDDLDLMILCELAAGVDLQTLNGNLDVKARLAYKRQTIKVYLEQLSARVHGFVQSMEKSRSGSSSKGAKSSR